MGLNIPEGLSSASVARIVIEVIELKEKSCKWERSKKILRHARKILLSPDDASDFLGEGFRNEYTQTDSENQKITKKQKLNRKDIPNHQDVFATISTSGKSALRAKSVSELSYDVKKSRTKILKKEKEFCNRNNKENRAVKHSKKFHRKKSSKSSVEKLQLNINLEPKTDLANYQKKTSSDSPSKYVKSYAQLKILPSESVLQNNVQLSDISTAKCNQLQRSFVDGSEEFKRVDSLPDATKSNNFNSVLVPEKLAPSLNTREENKFEITIISGNYGNGKTTTESNQQVKSEIGISAANINVSDDCYYLDDIETISPNTEQLTMSSLHFKQQEQSYFEYDVADSVIRKRDRLKPVEQNDPDVVTKDEDKTLSSHLLPQADEYNNIQQRLPLTESRNESVETDNKKRLNSNQKWEIDSADFVVNETEDSSQQEKKSNGFSSTDKETIALISPQAYQKGNRINQKCDFIVDKYDLKNMKNFLKLPVPESIKNTYLSNFNRMENQTKYIRHIKPCSVLIKRLDTNKDPVVQFPTLERNDTSYKKSMHYHNESAYLNSRSMEKMPTNYRKPKTQFDGGRLMLLRKQMNYCTPDDRTEPKSTPFVTKDRDSVKKKNSYSHTNDKNINSESTSTTSQSKSNWTCGKNKSYSSCKVKGTITRGLLHKYSPRYACKKSQKLRSLYSINESCKNSAQRENNGEQMSECRTSSTKDSSSSRLTYGGENSAQSMCQSSYNSNKDIEHLKLQRLKVGKTRKQSRMNEVILTSKCEMKEIFKTNDFKQSVRKAWITHNQGEIASHVAKPLLKNVVLPESSSKEQTKDPFNNREGTLVTNYTLGVVEKDIFDQSKSDREELCHSNENSEKKLDFFNSCIILETSSVNALNCTSDTRVAVEKMGNDIFHLSKTQVKEQSEDNEGEDIQSDGVEPTSLVSSQSNISPNSTHIPESSITDKQPQLQKETYLSPESQMLSEECDISNRSMVPVNPPQHPEKCRSLSTPQPLENLSPKVALLPKCPLENSHQHPSSLKSPSLNIIRVENDSPVKSPPRKEHVSEDVAKSDHETIDPVRVRVSSQLEHEVKNYKSGEKKVDQLDVNEDQQISAISKTIDKAPPQRSAECNRKPADVISKSHPIIRKSCAFPSDREKTRNWDQTTTVRDTNRYSAPPFQNVRAKKPLLERPPLIFTPYPNLAIFDSYPQISKLKNDANYDPWYYPIATPNAKSYFRSGEQTYQHPNASYWKKERYSYNPYSDFSSHYGTSYQQDFQRRSHSLYPYSRTRPPVNSENQRTAKHLSLKYSQREENKSCSKGKEQVKHSEGTTNPTTSESIARKAITSRGENRSKSETTHTNEKHSKTVIVKESENLTEIEKRNENLSKMGRYRANENFTKFAPTGNHSETVVTRTKGNAIEIISTGNLNERVTTTTSEIFSTGVSENFSKAKENENPTELASNENLREITMKSENFSRTIIAQTNENLIEITTQASENLPKTQIIKTSENQVKIISRVSTNLSKIAISQTNKNLIERDKNGSSENLPKCKRGDPRKSAIEIGRNEDLYKMATTKINAAETNENVTDITATRVNENLSKTTLNENFANSVQIISTSENVSKMAKTGEFFPNSTHTIQTSENLLKPEFPNQNFSNTTQTIQTSKNLSKIAITRRSKNSSQTIQTCETVSNSVQTFERDENLSETVITSENFSSSAQTIQTSKNISKPAITEVNEILTKLTTEESETFSEISRAQSDDILTLRGTDDENELSRQNQILRSFPKSTSALRSKCFVRSRPLLSCPLISSPFPNPPKPTQNESLLRDPRLSKKEGNLPNPSLNAPKCLFPMPPPLMNCLPPILTPEVVKYLSRIPPPPKIMQNIPLPKVNNLPHLIQSPAKNIQSQLMLPMKYHLPNLPLEMRYLSPDMPLTPVKYPSQNPIVVLSQDKDTLLNPPLSPERDTLLNPPLPPEKDPLPNPPLPPDDDPSPDPPLPSEKDSSPNPALPLENFSPYPPLPQEEYPSCNPPLPTEEYPSQNQLLSRKPSPSENPPLALEKYISETSAQTAEENLADGSPQNPELNHHPSDDPQLAPVKYSAEGIQLHSETYTSSYRNLFPKKYLFQSPLREKTSTFNLSNVTNNSQKLPFLEDVVVESENTSSDLVIPLRKINSASNKATSDLSQIRISKLKYSRKLHKCKHRMHKSGKPHSHHLQKSFRCHKVSYTVQTTPLFSSAKCAEQRSSPISDAQDASRTSELSYQKSGIFQARSGISNISPRFILERNELETFKASEDSAASGKLVTELRAKQRSITPLNENTNNSSSSNVPFHDTIASISSSTSTSDNVEISQIPNSLTVADNLLSAQRKSEEDNGTSAKQCDASPHSEITRSRHYIHSPAYSTDLFDTCPKRKTGNTASAPIMENES